MRTVYILASPGNSTRPEDQKLTPVQIKVGISDGVSTEVLDGLEEGAQIVTGMTVTGDGASSTGPRANPFGGGGFRRF